MLNRRQDIDGLRAISVIAVVLFHAYPNALPGGFVGVDIFFVISGFLITNILLTQAQNGTIKWIDFYCKRVRRLFPALITVLSVCLIASYFGSSAKSVG
jgi:peptidoglycan/LPS O-acetylase OafA/YrhL